MQGITLYIILGTLVVVVIIFLFATSVVERKKQKEIKKQKKINEEKKKKSGVKVAIVLDHIIKKNNYLLKNFVPSVGKLKMSEVRSKAISSLLILKKSDLFVFFKSSDFNELKIIFDNFKKHNSNIWKNKFSKEIKIIQNLIQTDKSIKAIPKPEKNYRKKKFCFRTHKNDTTPKHKIWNILLPKGFRTHKNDITSKIKTEKAVEKNNFKTHKNDITDLEIQEIIKKINKVYKNELTK